jgi:hypothetical protein
LNFSSKHLVFPTTIKSMPHFLIISFVPVYHVTEVTLVQWSGSLVMTTKSQTLSLVHPWEEVKWIFDSTLDSFDALASLLDMLWLWFLKIITMQSCLVLYTVYTINMLGQCFLCMIPIIIPHFVEYIMTKVCITSGLLKEKAIETICRNLRLVIFYPIILLIQPFRKFMAPTSIFFSREFHNLFCWALRKICSSHFSLNIRILIFNLLPKSKITHNFIQIKQIIILLLLKMFLIFHIEHFLLNPFLNGSMSLTSLASLITFPSSLVGCGSYDGSTCDEFLVWTRNLLNSSI